MGVQVRRATEHGPQSMDWQMLSYQNSVKREGTRHQVAKVLVRGMCLWEGRSAAQVLNSSHTPMLSGVSQAPLCAKGIWGAGPVTEKWPMARGSDVSSLPQRE